MWARPRQGEALSAGTRGACSLKGGSQELTRCSDCSKALLASNSLCTKHCTDFFFFFLNKYVHHLKGKGKYAQRVWGWHWFTHSWSSNSDWFPLNMPRFFFNCFFLKKDLLHAMRALRNSPLKPRTKTNYASKLFTSRFIAELFNLLYTGNCLKRYFFCTTFFWRLLKTH